MLLLGDHLLHLGYVLEVLDVLLELQDGFVVLGRLHFNIAQLEFQVELVLVGKACVRSVLIHELFKIGNLISCLVLNFCLDLFLVNSKVVLQTCDFVVSDTKLFLELFTHFFSHESLHQIVVVFEGAEFSVCHIELVDHLVALSAHLSVDDDVDIAKELLTFGPVVNDLHVFQVDDMAVLVAHDLACLHSLPEVLF